VQVQYEQTAVAVLRLRGEGMKWGHLVEWIRVKRNTVCNTSGQQLIGAMPHHARWAGKMEWVRVKGNADRHTTCCAKKYGTQCDAIPSVKHCSSSERSYE
jgi:hypothetical protein